MMNPFALVSTAKITAWLLAFNVLSAGAAYVYGRIDGARICTANEAWLAEDLKGRDNANADAADEDERAAIRSTEQIEASNDDLEKTLSAGVDSGSAILSRGWLQNLGNVR